MLNSHHQDVENIRVRVRCPDCRTHFHERLHRIATGESVRCPSCHNEMRFHGIGHIHEHDNLAAYIRHVEQRTCHPHFSLSD